MSKFLPELSKQIHSEVIREVIDKNYASIIPVWVPFQLTWVNSVYRTFYDYEKYMIVMYLLKTTFETYAKNLTTLNYDEYFNQFEFEIERGEKELAQRKETRQTRDSNHAGAL